MGFSATVNDASLRELGDAFDRATARALEGVAAGVAFTAETAAALERSLMPVDTGAARDGVKVRYSDSGRTAQVGIWDPDLYYVLFIEWGTTIRPAVPVATPAAEQAAAEFVRNVIREVRRKVR